MILPDTGTRRTPLFTSNQVLDETATLMGRRDGFAFTFDEHFQRAGFRTIGLR